MNRPFLAQLGLTSPPLVELVKTGRDGPGSSRHVPVFVKAQGPAGRPAAGPSWTVARVPERRAAGVRWAGQIEEACTTAPVTKSARVACALHGWQWQKNHARAPPWRSPRLTLCRPRAAMHDQFYARNLLACKRSRGRGVRVDVAKPMAAHAHLRPACPVRAWPRRRHGLTVSARHRTRHTHVLTYVSHVRTISCSSPFGTYRMVSESAMRALMALASIICLLLPPPPPPPPPPPAFDHRRSHRRIDLSSGVEVFSEQTPIGMKIIAFDDPEKMCVSVGHVLEVNLRQL